MSEKDAHPENREPALPAVDEPARAAPGAFEPMPAEPMPIEPVTSADGVGDASTGLGTGGTDLPARVAGGDDPAFLDRVMRYLEDDLPKQEVLGLGQELASDAAKRDTFMLLSLSDALSHAELGGGGIVMPVSGTAAQTGMVLLPDAMTLPARRMQTLSARVLPPPGGTPPEPPKRPRWPGITLAAAILVLVCGGLLTWRLWPHVPAPLARAVTRPSTLPTTRHFAEQAPRSAGPAATLSDASGARWYGPPVLIGTLLENNARLRLTAGLAKVAFAGGASVVLQAPADFTLYDNTRGILNRGRLSALVPAEARPLGIRSGKLTVTAAGGAFGMVVAADGDAKAHVLDGTMTAALDDGASVTLGKGLAARCRTSGGTITTQIATPDAFVRAIPPAPVELPAPVAAYDFDEDGGAIVRDKGAGPPANGTIHGKVARVSGPPGIPHALQFDGKDGWVDLGNPSKLDFAGPITLTAWARPEMTSGYRDIVAHGYVETPTPAETYLRINAGMYEAGSWKGVNPRVVNSELDYKVRTPVVGLGKWAHIAGVYDGKAWRMYRDGRLVATSPDKVGALSIPASWCIGAGANPQSRRVFKGAIAAVRVFHAALNEAQVAALASAK